MRCASKFAQAKNVSRPICEALSLLSIFAVAEALAHAQSAPEACGGGSTLFAFARRVDRHARLGRPGESSPCWREAGKRTHHSTEPSASA